jgi:AAA family ATP:ADP antiporter
MSILNYLKTERGKIYGSASFLTGLSAMFCFMGYEFIRSSSESIFLSRFSAVDKTYALFLTPFFLFFLIYLYGVILSRYGAMFAMSAYFIFSFFSMFILYFFTNLKITFFIFFTLVFKESYVVILSEMYWSYINSILKADEAKIINGPLAGLGALGSLSGGYAVFRFAKITGSEFLILLSAVLLIPAYVFFRYAYRITGEPQVDEDEKGGKKGHIHLSILKENRTVLFIAFIVFIAQSVSTLADINFSHFVKKEISDTDIRTAYLGSFWMRVNIISFTMQFLITPYVLKRFKIKYVLVSIPSIHLLTSLYCYMRPSLLTSSVLFMLFKSFDYSIYRASKEILYIPFSYDTRYRVKQFVDAFIYRSSKAITSGILSILNLFLLSYISSLAIVISVLSILWTYTASKIKTDSQGSKA